MKSLFRSHMTNIKEYNFFDNPFAQYYGFTSKDLHGLFADYKVPIEDQLDAHKWYDGYRFSTDPSLKMYNPWAIVNFLTSRKVDNYWEESDSIDFISKLFKNDALKAKVQMLVEGEDVALYLSDLSFSKKDFQTLQDLLGASEDFEIKEPIVEMFYAYILASGYLTLSDDWKGGPVVSVKAANFEVKTELEEKIVRYFADYHRISTSLVTHVPDEFKSILNCLNKDTQHLKHSTEKLFNAYGEDDGEHGNEIFVHSVINFAAVQIKFISTFTTEICYKKEAIADIVFTKNQRNWSYYSAQIQRLNSIRN